MKLLNCARQIASRDPAARNTFEVFMLYPGFHAMIYHKLSAFFFRHKCLFLARWVSQICNRRTGIEIHPGAKIGEGLFIDHGHGVVIGETAVIGDNCTIYHQVTLGGTGHEKHAKRHPTIGNNVLIGAGAKILGPVTVGDNAMIGAGSVVLCDVPANSTFTGVKARLVKQDGIRVTAPSVELQHDNVPDPFDTEICKLHEMMEKDEASVKELLEKIKKQQERERVSYDEDIQHNE